MSKYDKRSDDYIAGFEEALTRIYNTMYGLLKAFESAAGEDLDPLTTAQLSHLQTDPTMIAVHAEYQKWHDLFDDEELKGLFKKVFIKPLRQRLLALQPFLVKMTQIIEKEPPRLWRGERPPPGAKMFTELFKMPKPGPEPKEAEEAPEIVPEEEESSEE